MGSEAAKQMRRYTRVAAALNQTFAPEILAKLKPVALAAGVLTLEVADGPLLAELRQHRAHELQSALIATGSGVTKVIWRLRRAR